MGLNEKSGKTLYLHVCELESFGYSGVPMIDTPLKWFVLFHLPSGHIVLILLFDHIIPVP